MASDRTVRVDTTGGTSRCPAPFPPARGATAVAVDGGRGPLVLLLHGFPEQPGSWHNQVGPLVAAGHRVVVPYLRGYGHSPVLADPAFSAADRLAGDVVGVIGACGGQRTVVGGVIRAPASRGRRRRAAPGASPRGGGPLRFLRAPPGQAALRPCTGRPPAPRVRGPGGLCGVGRDVQPHRFYGGPNVYRVHDLNWSRLAHLAGRAVDVPAAFVAGERDLALALVPPRFTTPRYVTDLRAYQPIPGVGHWVQQEAPEATTDALLAFLEGLDAR